MKELLIQQLNLQNQLNINTCGENWKDGVTSDNKLINWRLDADMELSELIDSLPWKHWKEIDKPADYKNIHIELVDVWHFILSDILTLDLESSEIVNIISNVMERIQNKPKIYCNKQEFHKDIIEKTLLLKNEITKINKPITNTDAIKRFFLLCNTCNLDYIQLSALYFGKNYLNEFRQLNGYKEGLYRKIWSKDREDNDFMYDIVISCPTLSKQDLIKKFETIYKECINEAA